MKIGIFSDTYLPDINGVATSTNILRNELLKQGHDVLLITTELPDNSEYYENEDSSILRLPGIELKKLYGYRVSNIYSFKGMREIKNANLDVIHIQTEFGIGIFGKIVAEILNLPVVYTYHTMYADYSHYISKRSLIEPIVRKFIHTFSRVYGGNCTELIVPSQKTKDALSSYGIEKDMHIIATGLELDSFDPQYKNIDLIEKIKEDYQLKDTYNVVFLGRIAKEKSIDLLIKSMRIMKDRKINTKLLIVGGGPAINELEELSNLLDVNDMIVFTGPKKASLVPSFYHASDVFVSASITETQGLTFIEAMASGIPALARPDKNLEEIIIDGRNGFYFNDEIELANLIEKLMQEDLTKIKENAYQDAQNFSSINFCKQVLEVYHEAIKNKHYVYEISAVYPLANNFYEVVFKSDSNEVTLELSEKIILKYDLEKHKIIEREELDDLKDYEKISQAYKKALKLLIIRDYTYKQMHDKLSKTEYYEDFHIDMTLQALIEKNLINDEAYTDDYLRKASRTGIGIHKAVRKLKEKGISEELLNVHLINYSKDIELENAKDLIEKIYSNNNNKSQIALKKAIKERLFYQGFENDIIEKALNEFEFDIDFSFEKALLQKEANKAVKRYSKKHKGIELSRRVYIYLRQKGFESKDIKEWQEVHMS